MQKKFREKGEKHNNYIDIENDHGQRTLRADDFKIHTNQEQTVIQIVSRRPYQPRA